MRTTEARPPLRTVDLDPRLSGGSPSRASWSRRVGRVPFVALIRFYQVVVSPWTAPSCRYYPSCSQYALIAIERHGVLRGGWMALRRLGRCHPWTPGGVDHVPPARRDGVHPGQPTSTQGA